MDADRGDWDLIANKSGVTRLGFSVMLKFYEIEGRFPAYLMVRWAAATRRSAAAPGGVDVGHQLGDGGLASGSPPP